MVAREIVTHQGLGRDRPRRRPQWPGPPHEALLNSAMNKSGRGEREEERKEQEEEGERATGVER